MLKLQLAVYLARYLLGLECKKFGSAAMRPPRIHLHVLAVNQWHWHTSLEMTALYCDVCSCT